MYEYWNRRPVAKAVQANSLSAVQHWIDSLSPADKQGPSQTISDIAVAEVSGGFRLTWTSNDGTGNFPGQLVAPLGDYLVMNVNYFETLSPDSFVARFERAVF